jgi:hypothetical protein
MKGKLGTLAALTVALLAIAPLAQSEEQTRESYKAQVEPICQANREANERIMDGVKEHINRDELTLAGKQFVRVSRSFGTLIRRLAEVPPPSADDRRVHRWLTVLRLLRTRLRLTGQYYKEGEKIKATHMSILMGRSGVSANNASIVFRFHYCHFVSFDRQRAEAGGAAQS